MTPPFFSIIIPTYNSEKTLGYTLESINRQEFPSEEYEILVVDGGSTDGTIAIAEKYGVRIVNNPYRLPEYAKLIGSCNALGKYMIRMDSDEEFSYETQLREKMDFFKNNPDIKVLLPNKYSYGRKELCGVAAEYMNILGDPYSYFIYKTKVDKYETYKKNIVSTDGKNAIMRFSDGEMLPLVDSGTSAVSLDFIKDKYLNDYNTIEFVCSTYDVVIKDTGLCGCIKGDDIKHNCRSSFREYLSKLKFRVINNIFCKEESGFSAREKVSTEFKKRKILFGFYALCFPLVLLDSIRLAIIYKNISFLLHFIYLYYVCILVLRYQIEKILGLVHRNDSYGLK